MTVAVDRARGRHAPSGSEGLAKWWGVLFIVVADAVRVKPHVTAHRSGHATAGSRRATSRETRLVPGTAERTPRVSSTNAGHRPVAFAPPNAMMAACLNRTGCPSEHRIERPTLQLAQQPCASVRPDDQGLGGIDGIADAYARSAGSTGHEGGGAIWTCIRPIS